MTVRCLSQASLHTARLAAGAVSLLLLQGCAGSVSPQQRAGYETSLSQGNYTAAAQSAVTAGGIKPDGSSDNLFWSLNAGSSLFYSGSGPRAVLVLENAETLMKKRDVGQMSQAGQYRAATYDGVMANTYKALAFVEAGQLDQARVEFNRAEDRQRRAEDEFEAEAAKNEQKLQEDAQKAPGVDMTGLLQKAQSDDGWQQQQGELSSYAKYQPFINPLTYYLHGVFFLATAQSQSDYEKARKSFERVLGLIGPSPLIDAEIKRTKDWARSGKGEHKVWVVVEDGQSPTIGEYRLILPVPIIAGKRKGVKTMTIAMPRLQFSPAAYPALTVGDGTPTAPIGSFDAVVASEFRKRAPGVMAAAVAEAVLKIAMENAVASTNNQLLGLVADVAAQVSSVDSPVRLIRASVCLDEMATELSGDSA